MISITILSLDRKNDLQQCIESLYRFTDTGHNFEVVVIDQNSNEETKSYLKNLAYRNLKLIFLKENIGCSRGRKKALEICSPDSEFVFQADNDIVFTDGWLCQLMKDISKHPDIGALQARCVSPTGKILLNGGKIERYGLDNKASDNGYIAYFKDNNYSEQLRPDEDGLLRCDYVSGGATLFRRNILQEINYDEEYQNGYEDYDLSLRMRSMGWRLACDFNVALVHNNRRFKDEEFRRKEANYIGFRENSETLYRSLLTFIRKHEMNPIRSDGFDAIIRDERGRPFSEYSDSQLKSHFDLKI